MKILDTLDPARVRERMIALNDKERRELAKDAQKAFDNVPWHTEKRARKFQAAALAWLGTATARKITSEFWRVAWELDDGRFTDDVYAVLAARGRHFFATLARGLLPAEMHPGATWRIVRRGVREGLIERPDGPEYIEGMVFGVAPASVRAGLDDAHRGLLADPQLLDEEIWLLFEHDVASTLAIATTYVEDGEVAPGFPKYKRDENHWLYALRRLSDEGRLDRERLLDASLDALMRDFRGSSVGWYAQLHEALEPTPEERGARASRYVALLTSTAPAVVKEGLHVLKSLDDVPAEAIARVAPSVFAQRQKNLALETLRLLERLAAGDDARPAVLEAAASALAHERADVQERALKLLEKYPGEAPRATLLAYVDVVSPALRARVAELTGLAAPAPGPVVEIDWFPEPRVPELAPGERLEQVRTLDELIEVAASLLEGQGDGDDGERFLDGVARLCDERPERFKQRTAGLVKQAGEFSPWLPPGGQELVATVVRSWINGDKPTAVTPQATIAGILGLRVLEVALRASRRQPRALLAFPTHRGGWLDPAAVEPRDTTSSKGLFRRDSPDHNDRAGARLRTVRDVFLELEPVVHERDETKYVAYRWGALPSELADVGEIPISLEKTGVSSQWWQEDRTWLADDALAARWNLTLLPALPELQFARALTAIVGRIDATMYRHPEVVLEHALDPAVPMRDPGWDMAAAALVAKAPDLQRLGVDLVVATVEDERYDAAKLGRGFARLLGHGVGSATRLGQPLRDAGRVSQLHAAQVIRAVAVMTAALDEAPHGLHAPLEAASELSAGCGYRVAGAERDALERIAASVSPSAKLAKLARALMA